MLRSLMSGVSGVRGHQTFLDVVANNVANVNTTGFKKSRVSFQDILYQTNRGASAPTEGRGGINGVQVGLGTRISAIETIHSQGGLEQTGARADVAIQGDGYYIMMNGEETIYTRAGNFNLDADRHLVQDGTGYRVQGFMMASDPNNPLKYNRSDVLSDIIIPLGAKIEARKTSLAAFRCNLDSGAPQVSTSEWDPALWDPYADPPMEPAPAASSHSSGVEIFDSLGSFHELNILWVKTETTAEGSKWSWTAHVPDLEKVVGRGEVTFDSGGRLVSSPAPQVTVDFSPLGAEISNIALDFTGASFGKEPLEGVTQFGSPFTTKGYYQDGYATGVLDDFSVGSNGTVIGRYTNGQNIPLYRISLATFVNPAGLHNIGDTHFRQSSNSGIARVTVPQEEDAGSLLPGVLERSNVDLGEQFTELILAQRGFQANARVIVTSDQVLQEAVNVKK